MVTQQILVLFFLVRVQVAQQQKSSVPRRELDKYALGYGVMVTQQILVLFFLVRVQVAQQIAQMAESVDALVSNTSGVTSIPVRPRVWVLNKRLSNELSIT